MSEHDWSPLTDSVKNDLIDIIERRQQITKCHSCDPISQQVCNDDPRLCGRETKYPIAGYAPGDYYNQCRDCGTKFIGDKRAWQCEPCAIRTVQERDSNEQKNQ